MTVTVCAVPRRAEDRICSHSAHLCAFFRAWAGCKKGRLLELSLSPSRRNPLGLLLGFYTLYCWLCLPQPFLFCSHQHSGSGTESIQGWESGGGKQQTQDSHIWPLSFLSNLSKHSWKSHIILGKSSKQFFSSLHIFPFWLKHRPLGLRIWGADERSWGTDFMRTNSSDGSRRNVLCGSRHYHKTPEFRL